MSFSSCTQIGFWYLFHNYRPIGLLPSLCKILEKCPAKQMNRIIEKIRIFIIFNLDEDVITIQHSLFFIFGRKYIMHWIKTIQISEYTISICFDTVSHRIKTMVSEDSLIFGSLIIWMVENKLFQICVEVYIQHYSNFPYQGIC